jgi:branched-subunit amino acid transport protein
MTTVRNEGETVETTPASSTTSLASRLVAIVISALVYGVLVYISNFAPNIFGMKLFYPATSVGPAFGSWFGFWGGLGLILGTLLSSLPAGLNPLPLLPAYLVQGLYAWLPALLYRGDTVRSWRAWLRFAAICALTAVLASLVLVANLAGNGTVPFSIGMRSVFPVTTVSAIFWMAVVGPLILNLVSPYVAQAGLKFRRFF